MQANITKKIMFSQIEKLKKEAHLQQTKANLPKYERNLKIAENE